MEVKGQGNANKVTERLSVKNERGCEKMMPGHIILAQ